MRDNSKKIAIIKTIYGILLFIISVVIIGKLSHGDNADMTAQMSKASLPVVTLINGDSEVNPMQGYISEMDVSHMRGSVFPVGVGRHIQYKINTFGGNVTNPKFEVRTIDGSSLVESTPLMDYREDSGAITGSFQIKDLITSGTEYMLVFVMDTAVGQARYYTRIVWTESEERYNIDEELDFVKSFSAATFNKNEAKEYSKYLESNSEGDNTTFSKVNIHSSFNQITWGNLNITKHTEPEVYVTDIHSQTGSYKLCYRVTVKDGTVSRLYNVEEAFRVRHTTDRIYLLNYERTMNYLFDAGSYSISSNTIGLSISSPDIQLMENGSGGAFAFVSENRLFMFNNSETKLAYLFGFYDTDNNDIRTRQPNHCIKILKVDEAGNVKFAVAGYMSRGIHEGQVGIAVYDYNASLNAVEEQVFIESNQSPEILVNFVDTLAYVGSNDVFYVMIEQNIHAIDLIGRTSSAIVDDIGTGDYKISESERTIAWQSKDLKSFKMMNLNTKAQSEIEADSGDYIMVLGFMGEDLVYGLVHSEDVQKDRMGNPVYPMYALKIQDSEGNILENYHPKDIYVTDVNIVGNQIKLTRVVRDEESGEYVSTYDDQIMSTLKAETGSNSVSAVSVDTFEKIVQISAKSEIKVKQLRVLTPNQTLYEGSRTVELDIDRDRDQQPFYYVYGLLGIEGIYSEPAAAVSSAFKAPGTVVGDDNRYVWLKGNLLRSNQIMSITRNVDNYENITQSDPTVVCLDLILQFEGINRNVENLLNNGEPVIQILSESLPDTTVLDLDGCPMSSMLYYVNQDLPVMAMLNDGTAMLLIGFNDLNTVLMNPVTGQVYKYGMNDSEKLFSENGNHFVTYIRNGR
jgi:hypothetical protein